MCKLNPKQSLILELKLEAYTSHPHITSEQFRKIVMDKLLEAEIEMNNDGRARIHIWLNEDKSRLGDYK